MNVQRRILITGAAGQDGHYLSELLLAEGSIVYGLEPRRGHEKPMPLGVISIDGDVTDFPSLFRAFAIANPDEVYNLAGQSHVLTSFKSPIQTWNVNAVGVINCLELCRSYKCRFYQASSSEMFGNTPGPLNEQSQFTPLSPYAIAKLAAHHAVTMWREAYGVWAVAGILFNHESPLRGADFVTQKISLAAARVEIGMPSNLEISNTTSSRDWGHARDYVRAIVMMMRQVEPTGYVIATGETRTVADFIAEAEQVIRRPIVFTQSQKHRRPFELKALVADPSRARNELGWEPTITFKELVYEMVHDQIGKLQKALAGGDNSK